MSQDLNVLRQRGLDVDAALQYTGGEDRYIKSLNRFVNAYEKNRHRIESSYNNKDYDDYAIVVHSLKSNARMIGDYKLGDLAEKLQYAGQDKDEALIRSETEGMLKMYEELVESITPFIENEDTQGSQEIIKLAVELKEALDDYDYNKSIATFEQLKRSNISASDKIICNKISSNIEQFQYEEASDVVSELIENLQK